MKPIKMDTVSQKLIGGGHDPSLYLMDGCMLSKVDWGSHDPSLYSMNGCMLSEVDWRAHDSSLNHINGFLLSEADWGAHDLRFLLYLKYIDHDGNPNDFFIQGLWEKLQIIKGYRSSYSSRP